MNFGFISVLPPIIAIALALITKEVYSSLFIGILIGGAIYAGGSFTVFFEHVLQDGMVSQLSDSWNV
ncbi:MAG: Na+/H+ antiporter NhaC family protein, partial [Spirochaetia bacterium]|nr:Na+/H+ antiporter NhaC family protein [Spirochaetia bacterium]